MKHNTMYIYIYIEVHYSFKVMTSLTCQYSHRIMPTTHHETERILCAIGSSIPFYNTISTAFSHILWHLLSSIYVSNCVAYTHTSVTMLSGECSGLACAGKVSNEVITVLI